MNDFLAINGIYKHFGKTPVLNNIDIAAREGEFLVLVGPSGCGKSTLLSIIAGLEPADEGSISIGGEDMSARPPAERDIAMVFQSYALYPNMSVRQNIAFGMEMRGVAKAERERAVQEVAATLHIQALLDRKPSQLSGGQRQRVAMGRALVRQPRVFLFDEPLSNLDAKLRVDMRTEIKKLHQQLNATIVYVTHDQVEAMTLASKIVVMDGGVTRQIGSPDDIYNRPADLFVASFMGSPAMNLLRGKLRQDGDNFYADIGSHRLPLPADAAAAVDHLANSDIILGLRPEHISEHDAARAAAPQAALTPLALTADVVEPAGADTYLISKLGDQPLTARLRADCGAQVGQQITVACDMQRALLFNPQTGKRYGAE